MKNQLLQAIAPISFARSRGLFLRFHMNGTRIEQGGSPVLKNIAALFARGGDAVLCLHPWLNHREFTRLVRGMDVAMQVSFSETFNIVAADCAARGYRWWSPRRSRGWPNRRALVRSRGPWSTPTTRGSWGQG